MKYHIIISITALLLICTFYVYGTKFVNSQYVSPDYVLMADKTTADVASKLSKRYNMAVVGVGGGMIERVNVVGLCFQILGPLSKERLREIVVDCVEEFLASINANEPLRPFLKNYPFTSKEIRIEIFVVDANRRHVYFPEIMIAAQYEDEIVYRTIDKENELNYKSSEFEDYETALEIVRGNAKK